VGEGVGSKGIAINNAKKSENGGSGDRQGQEHRIGHAGGRKNGKTMAYIV
jgi:hypothetical protein